MFEAENRERGLFREIYIERAIGSRAKARVPFVYNLTDLFWMLRAMYSSLVVIEKYSRSLHKAAGTVQVHDWPREPETKLPLDRLMSMLIQGPALTNRSEERGCVKQSR